MNLKHLFSATLATISLVACANIGNPEGGPYDMTPPRLVSAKPNMRELNVQSNRIVLEFNEYIKLSGQDKLIISPPQQKPPIVTANGKHISVKLVDSLRPNTTYSFYFDDAIVDNNEDNPLEDFDYLFSTGKTIDTMRLSGIVLDAETLEPIPNLVAGAYWQKDVEDSTVLRTSFPFVGKTNKQGRFVVLGLKDSTYRVFALKDDDNDYRYNGQSEGFAFLSDDFKTSKLDSIKTDTIKIDSIVRRDTLYRDSIVSYQHTYYRPDDIVLRYFTPKSRQKGLQRNQREDSVRISLEFAEVLTHAPLLHSLDKPQANNKDLYLATLAPSKREAIYWLRDKSLIEADSIRFALTYEKTDSLMKLSQKTDTLVFMQPRKSEDKKPKDKAKPDNPLKLKLSGATGILAATPQDSLTLESNFPLKQLSPEQILVEVGQDSLYKPHKYNLIQDSINALKYHLLFERKYGNSYRVKIDSASIESIYGHKSDSLQFEQKVENEDSFGRLQIRLEGLKSNTKYIAQLLDKSGNTQIDLPLDVFRDSTKTAKATDSLMVASDSILSINKDKSVYIVEFPDLKPDTYYLRLFEDSNGDGLWTTGEYPIKQPENMYYSPEKYEVKKSFTTSEQWEPMALPLDKQKPQELLKTKPEERKKREDKNKEYYKRLEDKKRK